MNRTAVSLLVCAISLCASWCSAAPINIPMVSVGSMRNANDSTGFGRVDYSYRIGTTEVTNAQYAAFLNEKAKSDPLALYSPSMGSDARGGITRSGVSGSFAYASRLNMGDKPVNFVNWYDAIRFANWLNNGQGAGSTETGAYTILGNTATPSNGDSITRNIGATWFLPSENEWYKAAYYQPAAQGGDSDNYWLYPTRSNSEPALAHANTVGDINNPGANVANYAYGAVWNGQTGNVTTVGSAGSASFYGTYDQGGNVIELSEAESGGSGASRGGGFIVNMNSSLMRSTERIFLAPKDEISNGGFRVAAIPEPSTLALAAVGVAGLAAWGYRRRAINR